MFSFATNLVAVVGNLACLKHPPDFGPHGMPRLWIVDGRKIFIAELLKLQYLLLQPSENGL